MLGNIPQLLVYSYEFHLPILGIHLSEDDVDVFLLYLPDLLQQPDSEESYLLSPPALLPPLLNTSDLSKS